jgi:hypothetical protein
VGEDDFGGHAGCCGCGFHVLCGLHTKETTTQPLEVKHILNLFFAP